ncbi:MAG: DMT family transporter [Acidimicrobiia bacterium]|nr:DMT family transporter [Acidimicrobiia bacterium]MDH4306573.1 DMT family transporter [Acidimicrobiia bacterium]
MTTTIPRNDRNQFETTDWLLFGAIGVIWGSSFLFIAIGLEAFHPGLITWARVALGAAALALSPASRTRIDPADRPRLLALSVVWVAIPFTLFPLAETRINSAVAGLLNGATPIFAGLVGAAFFSRTPRGPQRLGLAVGFLGVALVSFGSAGGGPSATVGVVMVLAATLCYGIATNLAGSLQHRYGSVAVMSKMLALGTLWTAPYGIHGLGSSRWELGPALAVVALGVVGTGIAFVFMATLVGRVGGPRASFTTYVIPVTSLALGVIFLGDRVTFLAVCGVAVVIAGALLAGRREA